MSLDMTGTTNLLTRTAKAWHNKTAIAGNQTVGVKHFHGGDALSHGEEHLYLDPGA